MNDLEQFAGVSAQRNSTEKKLLKIQERIDKAMVKIVPLQAEAKIYRDIIAAIDANHPGLEKVADEQAEKAENAAGDQKAENPAGDLAGLTEAPPKQLNLIDAINRASGDKIS